MSSVVEIPHSTSVHFKNWLCTNQLTDRPTDRPTCAGKRWNKLACKPERGRARSLRETADETRQGEIEDMLACKRLSPHTWSHLYIYITCMLDKDRPYRPVWAWLLHHWGFWQAPSASRWVNTWQKWWGWGGGGHQERKQWNGWWQKLSSLVSGTTAGHQTHMTSNTEEVRSGG